MAANLAAVVAQSGRKVVLVDGDLRRPQVHRLFVTGNDRGLSSVLTGEASLQECVQRVELDRNVALLTRVARRRPIRPSCCRTSGCAWRSSRWQMRPTWW